MKNLQKVLALGLALIMLMSMFTVASAAEAKDATTLTDWDSINHQEAVALNVDLGIIKGMPDGSYKPTDNIDRASWAKLAYVAACGDEDAEAYRGTATHLTDIENNWAGPYISYLAANKYIAGDGTGKYNPDSNVTVVEACKTMLTILGYNAIDRGYENDEAWSGKIMTDAKANGLMDNVDKEQTSMSSLTRENAAQIIYNALDALTVEEVKTYDAGNKYVSHYNKDVSLGYKVFNLIKLEGFVSKANEDGTVMVDGLGVAGTEVSASSASSKVNNIVKGDLFDVGQFCTVFITGNLRYEYNGVGTPAIYSVTKVDKLVSKHVAPSDEAPVATITKGAKFATASTNTLYDDAGNSTGTIKNIWDERDSENYIGVDCGPELEYYVDGQKVASAEDAAAGDIARLYDRKLDDGKVDTVVINHYHVAQVTSNNIRTQKNAAGKETVSIPGVTTGFVPVDQVRGDYNSLKKDDVVLFYTNGKGGNDMLITLEVPATVTGNLTYVDDNGKRVTIDGSSYPATGIIGGKECYETALNDWNDFENEYTFYLDKNGGVCFYVQNTDAVVAGNVAAVLESKWIANGTIDATKYMQAKLLLANGDVVIAPIDTYAVKDAAGKVVNCTPSDKATNTKDKIVSYLDITGGTSAEPGSLSPENGFYSYRVTANGNYALTALTLRDKEWVETNAPVATTGLKVVKKSNFLQDGNDKATALSADNETVFMVDKLGKNDTHTYSVHTGYANVPAMNAGALSGNVVTVNQKVDGKAVKAAKYVFLCTDAFADDLPEGLVFVTDDKFGTNGENYNINVVSPTGGDKMKLTVADYDVAPLTMYVIDSVSEGVVQDMTKVSELTTKDLEDKGLTAGKLGSMGKGVVTFADGTGFSYDDATVCIVIDVHPKLTGGGTEFYGSELYADPEAVDTTDDKTYDVENTDLYVIANQDGLASYIYVVRTLLK